MNKCLRCGKEIAEGRKFCSRSCSASYNNVRRERKPWTEEQREKITVPRVRQVCKFCGKFTGKEVREQYQYGICEECRPFIGEQKLYRKVGILQGSLRERADKLRQKLRHLYVDCRMSLPDIYRETGIWGKTAWSILTDSGVRMRSKEESEDLAIAQGHYGITRSRSGSKITWDGKKVFYRSSYELKFSEELDKARIQYEVEPFRILYYDSVKEKVRSAIPDFYLPDTNEIIEIKSTWTYNKQNMRDKFKAYREAGYKPKLILNMKEVNE